MSKHQNQISELEGRLQVAERDRDIWRKRAEANAADWNKTEDARRTLARDLISANAKLATAESEVKTLRSDNDRLKGEIVGLENAMRISTGQATKRPVATSEALAALDKLADRLARSPLSGFGAPPPALGALFGLKPY